MRERRNRRWPRHAALVALLVSLGACVDAPAAVLRPTRILMDFLTPATVRMVTVEVSGPGLVPAIVINIPVGADSTAREALTITPGGGRRFTVFAFDSVGIATHRADTTLTLQPGSNQPLNLRLVPLTSSVGISVSVGGTRLTVADTATRVLLIGDTTRIAVSAAAADGTPIPADSLVWASDNPGVVQVDRGLVRALRAGGASVAVSARGASARVRVAVEPFIPAEHALVIR